MRYTTKRSFVTVAVLVMWLLAAGTLAAQEVNQQEVDRLAHQIRKQILALGNYGVFDNVSFGVEKGDAGYTVFLRGFASRPTLKASAEKVVRTVENVERVVNEIEVLPTSRQDEDIRVLTYVAIYGHPTLSRYNPNRGTPIFGARRRVAMGISNDPPRGYHPISIVVRNGHTTLGGVVDNDMDKQIAELQANSVSGVFSVTNELQVLNPKEK